MRFDREAPGEGAEVICSLENGKAVLEWRFYFAEESENEESEDNGGMRDGTADDDSWWYGKDADSRRDAADAACCGSRFGPEDTAGRRGRYGSKNPGMIRLALSDMQGNTVLEGIQPLQEEEPLCSVLLQPRLWSGPKDPYLYHLEAVLTDGDGRPGDRIFRPLALRSFSGAGTAGGFCLNGEAFERRAAAYTPRSALSETERQRQVTEDFRQLVRMGANCVYMKGGEEPGKLFLYLCDRLGLLLFWGESGENLHLCGSAGSTVSGRGNRMPGYAHFDTGDMEIRIPWEEAPVFRGERDCLFSNGSETPSSLFYRYLAKWGKEPFVYIIPESVKRLGSGNYAVRCYSNCGRIALYSDGTLFEFQRGEGEFTFSEVPARTPCIMLTAEGDGCSASLSLSKLACLHS